MNCIQDNIQNYLQVLYAPSDTLQNLEVLHLSLHTTQTMFLEENEFVMISCPTKAKNQQKNFHQNLLKNIFKALDSMEVEETLQQRELKRVAEFMQKSKQAKKLVDWWLKKFKEHGELKNLNLFLEFAHKEDKADGIYILV